MMANDTSRARIGRWIGACLALGLITATAAAQQPASIDAKIAKLIELRKQKADNQKAEAALVADIRGWLKDFTDKLADLGITPGPTPPVPPAPPKPDELRDKLAAAFKADKGTKDEAKKLASIYSEAAKLVLKKSAKGYSIGSSRQLIDAIRDVTNDGDWIGPDALPATRSFIASLWVPIFGEEPSDAALTEAQRTAAADLFARVAQVLEGL
jgi:hypothetical protein